MHLLALVPVLPATLQAAEPRPDLPPAMRIHLAGAIERSLDAIPLGNGLSGGLLWGMLLATSLMTLTTLSADELTQLQSKAASGYAQSQISLAIRLRDGRGITKNDAEAMEWAHKAADAGNAEALDFVGFVYLRGAVVERGPEIAIAYFKAAADESPQAAFNLGQCYFGAQGTEQDCAKGLEWWKKAAAKGHGRAAANAAMAYRSGEGVECDAAQARQLAGRAAELNDPSGLVLLGEMHFQAGELDAAKANLPWKGDGLPSHRRSDFFRPSMQRSIWPHGTCVFWSYSTLP